MEAYANRQPLRMVAIFAVVVGASWYTALATPLQAGGAAPGVAEASARYGIAAAGDSGTTVPVLPSPSPDPTPSPTPPPPPAPPPAPPVHLPVVAAPALPAPVDINQAHTNWVAVPSVGINMPLGDYTDCSGQAPVSRAIAQRDWCAYKPIVYLVGHNPGLFTPLTRAQLGDLVRYWDPNGVATTYRISSINRTMSGSGTAPYMMDNGWAHLDLQTCAVNDASQDWVFVANPV